MKVVNTVEDLRYAVNQAKQNGFNVGFVPTMGNLHQGHLSLVQTAKANGNWVVASIFVNPLQFDDASDLERYPRTLAHDTELLTNVNCDLLFAPNVKTVYPEGQSNHCTVHVPDVSTGLCGGSRPGHFDGVATVVSKLFNFVQPDHAYFGEKDFQQVAVINKMVTDLAIPVQLHRVPTARAKDGLALSSRNGYLSSEERKAAPELFETLTWIANKIRQGNNIAEICQQGRDRLNQPPWRCDYLEICDSQTLKSVTNAHKTQSMEWVILAAAHLGKARLIDNLVVPACTVESDG